MKNLLLLLISIVFLFSCSDDKIKYEKTSNIKLRQLVNSTETEKTSDGSAFVFFATYHSREEDKDYVKVFAEVDGTYRFIKFPIEDIRIKLDSTVTNPYLIIHYYNYTGKHSDSYILSENSLYDITIDNYTVVCSEKYLPEKLLPIDVTNSK